MYILRCADDSLYTGITIDVLRRVNEHNNDNTKAARYTRVRRPVKLVYQENCHDRSAASQREYQIKQLNRLQKLALITS
ncbi:GIY-YIG nuclease family protein [Arenicella sp.]|nr:GIY-YIG nuclease family protein [Arenicella sp.]